LLGKCLKLLAPTEKLFLSVNIKRSAPTVTELKESLNQYTSASDLRIIDLGEKLIDEDFKGRKTPKAFLLDKLDKYDIIK